VYLSDNALEKCTAVLYHDLKWLRMSGPPVLDFFNAVLKTILGKKCKNMFRYQ